MSTSAPSPAGGSKRKRQRMMIYGGAAVLLLVLLYARSRSTASKTNATNASDVQAAVDQAVSQQQQTDAATYGYGSFGSGGGGGIGTTTDLTPVTSSLNTLDTDLQNLAASQAGLPAQIAAAVAPPPASAAAAPPPSQPAAASAPVTINIGPAAQPTPAPASSSAVRMSTLTAGERAAGDIAAPFGATKPGGAPAGYQAVGKGAGAWVYAPIRPTGPATSQKKSSRK